MMGSMPGPTLDRNYWEERWREGKIGFHQATINPYLQKHFQRLSLSPDSHCLAPLCGKSLDIAWIASQGHRVTGIEISDLAVRQFFVEKRRSPGAIDRIKMICYDFFDLQPTQIPTVDWVYDRAAMVAFPPSQHQRYAEHLSRFLTSGKRIFLISFEHGGNPTEGPPFSVDETRIRKVFDPLYSVECIDRQDILDQEVKWRERGFTSLHEGTYILTKR
jgi:thiopurine S-methyltransferase